MVTIDELVAALTLEPDRPRIASGRPTCPAAHGVVFGGQLLAQSIVAGLQGHEAMTVKTVHTVFARSAEPDQPGRDRRRPRCTPGAPSPAAP